MCIGPLQILVYLGESRILCPLNTHLNVNFTKLSLPIFLGFWYSDQKFFFKINIGGVTLIYLGLVCFDS